MCNEKHQKWRKSEVSTGVCKKPLNHRHVTAINIVNGLMKKEQDTTLQEKRANEQRKQAILYK